MITIKINPHALEFQDILISAFRYALGRQTYIVESVSNFLIKYKDFLTDNLKNIMIKDLKEALKNNKAGDTNIDVPLWEKLLKELTEI